MKPGWVISPKLADITHFHWPPGTGGFPYEEFLKSA